LEKYDVKPVSFKQQTYVCIQFILALLVTAYLLLIAPSSRWLSSDLGIGHDAAQSIQYGFFFVAVCFILASVGQLQSATSARALRHALVGNGSMHAVIVVVAFMTSLIMDLSVSIAVVLAVAYFGVHVWLIASLWPKAAESC